jgi:hypothetical protein
MIVMAGCTPAETQNSINIPSDSKLMENAAKELVDVLWNVDYKNFTADKTTAYAKKYYDSDFLADYLDDIRVNSGVGIVVEEKSSLILSSKSIIHAAQESGLSEARRRLETMNSLVQKTLKYKV